MVKGGANVVCYGTMVRKGFATAWVVECHETSSRGVQIVSVGVEGTVDLFVGGAGGYAGLTHEVEGE